MRRPRSRRPWWLLGLSLALVIGVTEVGLRALYPLGDPFPSQRTLEIGAYVPYRHAPRYRLVVNPEPGLPGVGAAATFETNADGFVGPALTEGATTAARIFLVGGSTMECVALGTAGNPATLMQAALTSSAAPAVEVVNTGHSGDASFDHVAVLTHRIAHLRPRAVVFLVGINDLIAAARGERYDHPNPDQVVRLDGGAMVKLAFTRAHVGRLLWAAAGRAKLRTWDEDAPSLTTHYREAAERCAARPLAEGPPRLDLEGFERNLRTLVATTKAQGAVPVLATQPHAWDDPRAEPWLWMRCVAGHRYAPTTMAAALGEYNDVTRRVAAETGATLVDLATSMSGGQDQMYDDVHFNRAGAETLARELSAAVRPHLGATP